MWMKLQISPKSHQPYGPWYFSQVAVFIDHGTIIWRSPLFSLSSFICLKKTWFFMTIVIVSSLSFIISVILKVFSWEKKSYKFLIYPFKWSCWSINSLWFSPLICCTNYSFSIWPESPSNKFSSYSSYLFVAAGSWEISFLGM